MVLAVLGVDPGYANCGVALVSREGQRYTAQALHLVKTRPSEPFHARFAVVLRALAPMVERKQVGLVACERQAGAQEGKRREGATSAEALLVGQVVGALRALAILHGVPFVEVEPREAQRAMLGRVTKVTKAQVRLAVCRRLGFLDGMPTPMSEHESDAVAVAIAGWKRHEWNQARGTTR